MANIFDFRNELIAGYRTFSRSFTKFAAPDIDHYVTSELDAVQTFCPEPLIQINPSYAEDSHSLIYYTTQLGARGVPMLHERCAQIFAFEREGKREPLQLYRHQGQAITYADEGHSYIVTSGTGSGKSLTFFIPMVSRILQEKELDPTPRIRAIIVYPMNALANSQLEEINKFLSSVPGAIKVQRYTGQERSAEREGLRNGTEVPDILLTNYMMLEFMLLRPEDSKIIAHCRGLNFLVLDELHTYRGRQGSDVALLIKRLRQRVGRTEADDAGSDNKLICIGTSATRAEILKKLVSIEYLALNKKSQIITPTLMGEMVYDVVSDSIRPLLNPALTASWEKGLTGVADGTITPEEYMEKLQDFVARRTNIVKQLNNQSVLFSQFDAAAGFYQKQGAQTAHPAKQEE